MDYFYSIGKKKLRVYLLFVDIVIVTEIVNFRQSATFDLTGIICLTPVKGAIESENAEVVPIRLLKWLGNTRR